LEDLVFLFPPFFGEGLRYNNVSASGKFRYSVIKHCIFSQFSQALFGVMILFMLGLVLLKVVASSSTNGAGGVGGIFAPTLFIGGINGFMVASPVEKYWQVLIFLITGLFLSEWLV
jgi:CIC family chloride channel protein